MHDFEAELEADLPRGAAGGQSALVEARWLDVEELKTPEWRYRNGQQPNSGILLGYRRLDRSDERDYGIGSRDNRHVLTVAGSRCGKGVSLLVPNLLLYDGSVLAIDPKGELARITARARREKGQKVVVLDPFGENGRYPSGSFNPLDEIDPASPHVKDDVSQIADALIVGSEHDPHWTDSARILVKALILFTLTLPEEERNLVTVWRLLALTHPAIRDIARRAECDARNALFLLLKNCTDVFDGAVAGAGERFAVMADREMASIFSTALTQLEFLDSNAMASVLTKSDLRLGELKSGRTTLYLCLPATRMATHSRWLRVIINLALVAFEREKTVPDIPVLMMLDEFPVLGRMKALEMAAGLMAGFGVKLWVVLQDLSQIEQLYRNSWQTFIGNAGVALFWGNADQKTLEYISEKLGQTSLRVQQPSGATPGARLSGASPIREELRVQRLLASDEAARVLAREKRRLLVLAAGQRPVILKRAMYYLDEPFAKLFDPAVLK